MWTQVNETTALIQSLIAANQSIFASGYHFLGHSQGGLMMRSVIQNFDDHNVHTFVSMAGVQLGMCVGRLVLILCHLLHLFRVYRRSYGLPSVVEKFIPDSFRPEITDFMYNGLMQSILSCANYWHDVQNLTL
jgi:hypothetical protein